MRAWRKFECKYCKKWFYDIPSQANRVFCSMKCKARWQSINIRGTNHPNWQDNKIQRKCKQCGKEFYLREKELQHNNAGQFCSQKCNGKFNNQGKNNPNYSGGKRKRICQSCGGIFFVPQNRIDCGGGKYCSRSCAAVAKYYKNPKYNTSIEKKVKVFMEEQKIPFKQQARIKGIAVVDFLLNDKKIIQCDGDYWHSLPGMKQRDNNQDFRLRFNGYIVLRLKECDIHKHWRKCSNHILRFYSKEMQ